MERQSTKAEVYGASLGVQNTMLDYKGAARYGCRTGSLQSQMQAGKYKELKGGSISH